jgi:hypothetical protein
MNGLAVRVLRGTCAVVEQKIYDIPANMKTSQWAERITGPLEPTSPDRSSASRETHAMVYASVIGVMLLLVRDETVLLALRSGTGYADGWWNVPSVH